MKTSLPRVAFFLILLIIFIKLTTSFVPKALYSAFPRHRGIASWYSQSDPYINWLTANGEVLDDADATCASWDFPFGTYVKVTNIKNGKFVICRVNDRGPRFSLNRAIDLTKSGFEKIADPKLGLVEVTIIPVRRTDSFKREET